MFYCFSFSVWEHKKRQRDGGHKVLLEKERSYSCQAEFRLFAECLFSLFFFFTSSTCPHTSRLFLNFEHQFFTGTSTPDNCEQIADSLCQNLSPSSTIPQQCMPKLRYIHTEEPSFQSHQYVCYHHDLFLLWHFSLSGVFLFVYLFVLCGLP